MLIYQKLKYDSEPKYGQRRPDGNGGWISDLHRVTRVLYRLPDLIAFNSATVFVCEGEKDADAVAALSLCATSADSGTWKPDLVEPLRDRDVVVLPDFDSAGVKRALEAANALHGVAASIRMIFLPGLTGEKGNKDVSDWLSKDPARADTLAGICVAAPLWAPDTIVEGMAEAEKATAEVKATRPARKKSKPETSEKILNGLTAALKVRRVNRLPTSQMHWQHCTAIRPSVVHLLTMKCFVRRCYYMKSADCPNNSKPGR